MVDCCRDATKTVNFLLLSHVKAKVSGSIRATSRKRRLALEKTKAPVQTLENLEMKKTLVALAALAATSAFAQSTVTLSGNLDVASASVSGTQAKMNGETFTTRDAASSTSVIKITAVEDLGGGNTATVSYGLDPRKLTNDSRSQDLKTGLERDEVFVGLASATLGSVKLGAPNSIGLTAQGTSNPLGTGIGSGYAAASADGTFKYSNIRYDRSARYDSPAFAGFTFSALYAPGGDIAGTTDATYLIPNSRKTSEFGLSYANGPLNIAFVNINQAAQGSTGVQSTSIAGAGKTSVNALYANYKVAANTTVYAGWNDGDAKAAAATPSTTKGTRFGIKQTIGQIDLIAVQTNQETTTSAGAKTEAKITGLRADYNLSKTAAVYVGYEKYDNGATSANERTMTAVGIRKSF
jgi:predicted porin